MDDKERLEVLMSYRGVIYAECSKIPQIMLEDAMTQLEAMAELLGFEFDRHDSRQYEEIIQEEAPKKYQAKMLEKVKQIHQIREEEWRLYRATHPEDKA